MEFARINQAEGFFRAVGEENGMADDLPIEVNVCLRDGCHTAKFSWNTAHAASFFATIQKSRKQALEQPPSRPSVRNPSRPDISPQFIQRRFYCGINGSV